MTLRPAIALPAMELVDLDLVTFHLAFDSRKDLGSRHIRCAELGAVFIDDSEYLLQLQSGSFLHGKLVHLQRGTDECLVLFSENFYQCVHDDHFLQLNYSDCVIPSLGNTFNGLKCESSKNCRKTVLPTYRSVGYIHDMNIKESVGIEDKNVHDTRERLILLTLRLAATKGLDNTSLSDIAQVAGIRKASLYYHFPSREAMIEQMFAYCSEQASKQGIVISFNGAAEEVLSRAMEHWHRLYTTPPLSYFYRIVESQKLILPIAARTSQTFSQMMRGQSEILLETLSETGRLNIEELDLAVTMFSSTVQSFLTRSMISEMEALDEDDDLEWQEERFIRRFCELYGKCSP